MNHRFPISLSRPSLRLRYWCLRQIGHDLVYEAMDCLPDSLKQELFTLVTGHINKRPFYGVETDFPGLQGIAAQGFVLEGDDLGTMRLAADMTLEEMEATGTHRSGYLQGYVQEMRRNLNACNDCFRLVIGHMLESGRLAVSLQILKQALE